MQYEYSLPCSQQPVVVSILSQNKLPHTHYSSFSLTFLLPLLLYYYYYYYYYYYLRGI